MIQVRTSLVSSLNHRILEGKSSPREADSLGLGQITLLRVFALFIPSLVAPGSAGFFYPVKMFSLRTLRYSHENSQNPTWPFATTLNPVALKECFNQQMENSLPLQGMGHRNSTFETEQWVAKFIFHSKILKQVTVVTAIKWGTEILQKKTPLSGDNQCPRQKFSKTRISYLSGNNYKDAGSTIESASVTYFRSRYQAYTLHIQRCLITITESGRSMFLIL